MAHVDFSNFCGTERRVVMGAGFCDDVWEDVASRVRLQVVIRERSPVSSCLSPQSLEAATVFSAGYVAPYTMAPVAARRVAFTPQGMLETIRDTLPLSITELAALLEVSRPTIYAYMEGRQEPQPENLLRLERLTERVLTFASSELDMRVLMRRPLFDGKNLLERLKADALPADALHILQQAQLELQEQRQRHQADFKERRPVPGAHAPFTPLHQE